MTAVVASGINLRRGDADLLVDVSLEVSAGTLVGIVGPNGAGKSTLLRVLAGDIDPDTGRAALAGIDVGTASVRKLATLRSFVRSQTASDVVFRVGEVVAMGRHPFRDSAARSDDDQIVADAMAMVDIVRLRERQMRTLSSGEQQRVQLARAIAQRTPVILLDEPTSALDVGHQEMTMTVLRNLANDGVAVVSILHDLNLAAAHADQILLMDSGALTASGTPVEVLTGASLSAAYGYPIQVTEHPFRGCPLVLTEEPAS